MDACILLESRCNFGIYMADGSFAGYRGSVQITADGFAPPHSHMPSKMERKDVPHSVRLYATLSGIGGYSSRWMSWSASSFFHVERSVL